MQDFFSFPLSVTQGTLVGAEEEDAEELTLEGGEEVEEALELVLETDDGASEELKLETREEDDEATELVLETEDASSEELLVA